ncbi:MAG: SpoIIE family protein phosphatase, partial [Pseudonocardiaceae bacterium]
MHQSEKRFMRNDGEVVHALVNVSLTLDARGTPLSYVWQFVDVTEQRRAEAERAARAKAEAVAVTLGKLQQVTAAALEHLDLDELMRVLVERVRDVFDADFARVLLHDPGAKKLVLGAAAGFKAKPPDDEIPLAGVFSEVVLEGRSLTLDELASASGLDPMLALARPRALMAAPLTVKGRIGGVVELGTTETRRFTPEEESLLVLMADRAGLAIEHARAYEREVGTVEMLQRSLLPDRLPDLPGLRIAARYMPGGADVGGDWYDAIPLEDGSLGVAMGDVVGHGIAAASLMGQLRHAARAYAVEGHSPATVLDRLDRLVRSLEGAQMATLLYLVVDADLRSVCLASAGHM